MVKRKRVLVTGGSGFIASHLVKRLILEDAEIAITTKYNSLIDNIRLAKDWNDLKIIEADIRNVDSLNQIKEFKPEIIYHMAAYNHVGDSFLHVAEALNSNGIGTANLLESYKEYELFVYISTSETYGHQATVPFKEEMKPFPISPYAIGKYLGEQYALMMHHVHNLPIVILKPFNTFGPFQSPRAIIGEIIIKCIRGDEILSTEGMQTREFNYVDNIIDGLISVIGNNQCIGEVINLASNNEIKIKDLIQKIHKFSVSNSNLKIGALNYRPTEIWRMCGDATKARNILDWSPNVEFDDGLIRSIEWYRKFLKIFDDVNSEYYKLY